jgi:hypothetical protein
MENEYIDDVLQRLCESFSRGLHRRGEMVNGAFKEVRAREKHEILLRPRGRISILVAEFIQAKPRATNMMVASELRCSEGCVRDVRSKLRKQAALEKEMASQKRKAA